MKPTRERKVIQYALSGEKIKEYCSANEAARQTQSLDSKIILCCQLERKSHNESQWRYKEDEVDKVQSQSNFQKRRNKKWLKLIRKLEK